MEQQEREGLWMIFKVSENLYAINSHNILSIGALPNRITHVPDALPYVRGIVRNRGRIITLLDLRILFAEKSLEGEYEEFCRMIDDRKADHIRWMNALETSVREHTVFSLTTDPHQCALGRWYDSYVPKQAGIASHLAKIDEPHKKIHHAAVLIEQTNGEDAEAQKEHILKETKEMVMPQMLDLLEQTKTVLQEHYKSMIITLESEGGRGVAVIVDEIVGMETLEETYSEGTIEKMQHSPLLGGVALRSQSNSLVLLLDVSKILSVGDDVKVPAGLSAGSV